MKPRFEPISYEVKQMLEKAEEINNRLNTLEKADPMGEPKPLPKEKITDVNPHMVTESGGQTKTAYYNTNGNTIEYEDGKPKRAKADKKVDLGKLGGRMNPHAGTGVEREDAEGGNERKY